MSIMEAWYNKQTLINKYIAYKTRLQANKTSVIVFDTNHTAIIAINMLF